jgi:hypothetical protein
MPAAIELRRRVRGERRPQAESVKELGSVIAITRMTADDERCTPILLRG